MVRLDVVCGGPAISVLIKVGPKMAEEDVADRDTVFIYGVLRNWYAKMFDVTTELVVSD